MPKSTNGVYQDHSVKPQNCGVGINVAYPKKADRPGMGGNQYAKHGSHGAGKSHDGKGNSTYK